MEYGKKIRIYSGILAGLTVTAILGFVFSASASFQREASTPLMTINTDKIQTFTLPNGTMVQKKGETWETIVENKAYPSNMEKVKGFLKNLKEATRSQVASKDGQQLSVFALNSNKKLILKTDDNKDLTLLIGKTSSDGQGLYVKFDSEKEVILTSGTLARDFDGDFNPWTDLRVFSIPITAPEIASMVFKGKIETVSNQYVSYDMNKKTDSKTNLTGWYMNGVDAPIERGSAIAQTLADFKATENLPPTTSFDNSKVTGTLEITLDNGRKAELRFCPKDGNNKFPVSDGIKSFLLAEYMVDQILVKHP